MSRDGRAGLAGHDARLALFPLAALAPFLGGQGPAPAYATSLDESRRARLRDRIRERLPIASDGSIALTARAWAARATVAR